MEYKAELVDGKLNILCNVVKEGKNIIIQAPLISNVVKQFNKNGERNIQPSKSELV